MSALTVVFDIENIFIDLCNILQQLKFLGVLSNSTFEERKSGSASIDILGGGRKNFLGVRMKDPQKVIGFDYFEQQKCSRCLVS